MRRRRFFALVCAASVMAAAAAAEESLSVAAVVMSVPDSSGWSPEAEGGGAAGEEKDAATKGTVAVGDSEEDGDDVFEVERILDMKCEGVCGGCAAGGPGRGGAGGDGGGVSQRDARQPGTAWEDGTRPQSSGWMLMEVLSVVLAEETEQ